MYFVTRLQDCINARSRLGGRDDKVIGSVWIPSGYALEDDQRQTYATGALEITA